MLRKILVPIDGTPQANAALPVARTFARALGASVILLQVTSDPDAQDTIAAQLGRIVTELVAAGLKVTSMVRQGDPADEILQAIASEVVDLVVMCTHGRAGLERAVFGSVTEQVLAHAMIPLVLLRPGGRRIAQLKTLLTPVDGSPGGALGLGVAVALAQATGASLRVVQVIVPFSNYVFGDIGGFSYVDPAWHEEAVNAAGTYVRSLCARLASNGVQANGDTIEAVSLPQAIVAEAEVRAADLIVMSSHAHTGAVRALLGSTTDAVVRTAHCPVVVIRRSPPQADNTAHDAEPPPGGWVVA